MIPEDEYFTDKTKEVTVHLGGEYSYGIKDKYGNFKFVCRTPYTVKTKLIKRIWFRIKMFIYDLIY